MFFQRFCDIVSLFDYKERRGAADVSYSSYFDSYIYPAGVAISIVILMQEGKSNGLGSAIGGMADSYWSKNKGRSMEGALEHFTRYGAIIFMLITLILNVLLERMG